MAKSKTRCKLCKIAFASKAELRTHIANTPGHSKNGRCDCDGCNPSKRGLTDNDPRREFSARRKAPTFQNCQPCGLDLLLCKSGAKVHRKESKHRLQAEKKGLLCHHSEETFMTREAFDRHMKQRHDSSVTYHCIDCSQDFPSHCALKKHPRRDATHTKGSLQSGILCKPCERTFHTAKAYDNHLKLKEHKDIRCFAYPTCGRYFRTKAGMIAHLESGACKSKLNRQKLDDLIRQHDTANVVLKVEYSNPANLLSSGLLTPVETPSSLPPFHGTSFPFPAASVEDRSDSGHDEVTEIHYRRRSPSHTADDSSPFIAESLPFFTPTISEVSDCTIQGPPFVSASLPRFNPTISEIPDSDSDDEGTIILTPTSSISRRESFSFAPSSSVIPLSSGVSTPRSTFSTTLSLQRVFGRKCYLCNREFKNETAAQQHATSTAHAPRIYHCPTFLFPAGHAAKFPPRDFKSLSGLIAHLESGSCEGGKETLESAVKYVEERLRGVRMGGFLMEK